MRIKQVSVKGLFGLFDHTIPLNLEERITIIHGPNGFGKTALLKLTYNLLKAKYYDLRFVPFKSFAVDFDDGSYIRVTNSSEAKRKKANLGLEIHYSKGGKDEETFQVIRADGLETILNQIDLQVPRLVRRSLDSWVYVPTGETLSSVDVIERFGERYYLSDEPALLKEIRKSVPIHLIETQRLQTRSSLGRNSEPRQLSFFEDDTYGSFANIPAVTKYANELAENIKAKRDEFAKLSQTLDRAFPTKLIRHNPKDNLPSGELTERLKRLEEKRLSLTEAGLIDKDEETAFQAPDEIEENGSVLSIYVQDNDQKLSVFDQIASKIDLLKNIVEQHFLFKKISFNKDKGFLFTSETGGILSPENLSSGEQHQLVILYELLFRVEPNSLVLIDEPELSLHVVWQNQFIEDLEKIISLTDFDIVIATHSPDVIRGHNDLLVALKEPHAKPY